MKENVVLSGRCKAAKSLFPFLDLLEKACRDLGSRFVERKKCNRDLNSAFPVLVSSVLILGLVTSL